MLDDLQGPCLLRPPDALMGIWTARLSVQEGQGRGWNTWCGGLLETAAVNVLPKWEREQ